MERIYDKLNRAKGAFSKKLYEEAILYCGMTIESVLILAYKKLLPEIEDSNLRLKIVEAEVEFGKGSMNGISIKYWGQLFIKFNLFTVLEELFEIELNEAKNIDFNMIARLRNEAAHCGYLAPKRENEFNQLEAGFCIFQTSLLVEGLKAVIHDNYLKDINFYIQNSNNDPISYLKVKIYHIKPKPSDILDKILKEAIQISEINPEDALAKLRKSLETLLRELCSLNNLKHSGIALNDLMVKLSEKGKIPNRIFKQMEIVKQFGNRGVHPEGEQYGLKELEVVFIAFIVIVEWYLNDTMPNSV